MKGKYRRLTIQEKYPANTELLFGLISPSCVIAGVLTARLVVSLKGTHTDFVSLQPACMTLWYFWQVPVTCLPAAASTKHDGRMCRQPGEPEVFLKHKPMDIEETVRKHHPRKQSSTELDSELAFLSSPKVTRCNCRC